MELPVFEFSKTLYLIESVKSNQSEAYFFAKKDC